MTERKSQEVYEVPPTPTPASWTLAQLSTAAESALGKLRRIPWGTDSDEGGAGFRDGWLLSSAESEQVDGEIDDQATVEVFLFTDCLAVVEHGDRRIRSTATSTKASRDFATAPALAEYLCRLDCPNSHVKSAAWTAAYSALPALINSGENVT